jgi:hypothetical protein
MLIVNLCEYDSKVLSVTPSTANTPSIKAYIDNSAEFAGYTGTVLFERTLSTAVTTNTFRTITLSQAYTNFTYLTMFFQIKQFQYNRQILLNYQYTL